MNNLSKKVIWKIAPWQSDKVNLISKNLQIPPLVAHILINRGVDTPEKVVEFLKPSLKYIASPYSLQGMAKAVERILSAKKNNEKVWIFGDYDVDGIAGTALLVRGLKRFGLENVTPLLPERLSNGYGLTPEIVEEAKKKDVTLIITVDNGISTLPASYKAKELGVDLIITDHHTPFEKLPVAVSIINPKLEPPDHPSVNLCGAGVAFKLSLALNGTPNDLDLVAIATIADVMPLTGENRTLVALGLQHLAKYKRLGIRALAEMSSIELDQIDVEKISYAIAPRINAAGRLDNASKSLELILCEEEEKVREISKELMDANEERRNIENEIMKDAINEIESCLTNETPAIVLTRRNWHQGIIGLVASRLTNKYGIPVALISVDEKGFAKGSIRSSGGIDIIRVLHKCSHFLEQYGGHKLAAGFSLNEERLPEFTELLINAIKDEIKDEQEQIIELDSVINFSQIDTPLLQWLKRLEPVGYGNPSPLFCTANVEIVPHSVQVVKDFHVRMLLKQDNRAFYGIGYYLAERFFREEIPKNIDIVYTPKISPSKLYGGCQLIIRDFRSSI
ncbi:MAG: single-stranded-DNA-specific exonuclease RecJ [Candidatus Hydrogenedentes bacterium]|nr:single-stranded-DNA-specific exonuclease RecJ [Candidatus Hydrogenedentota bacterium]